MTTVNHSTIGKSPTSGFCGNQSVQSREINQTDVKVTRAVLSLLQDPSLLALAQQGNRTAATGRPISVDGAIPTTETAMQGLQEDVNVVDEMVSSGDPMIMLASLQSSIYREESTQSMNQAENAGQADIRAAEQRAEANKKAQAAARKAKKWMKRAPKWVQKLVKVVIVAAAAAAAVASGGAAAGLAIAGAVLVLGADSFTKLAVKLGMDPEKAKWIGIACQVAGAAMMGGAGIAGSASSVGSVVQNVAQATTQIIQGANAVQDGVRQVGGAVYQYKADQANIDAHGAQLEQDHAREVVEDVVESMKAMMTRFQSVLGTIKDTMQANRQINESMMQQMA